MSQLDHDEADDHVELAERLFTLRPLELFAELAESDIQQVARLLRSKIVGEGEKIIVQGALDRDVFIVKSGSVQIQQGERILATLGAGSILGELAAIDQAPRSASVIAAEPCHIYRLPAAAFLALLDERFEIAQGIITVLCRRLRRRIGQAPEGVVRY